MFQPPVGAFFRVGPRPGCTTHFIHAKPGCVPVTVTVGCAGHSPPANRDRPNTAASFKTESAHRRLLGRVGGHRAGCTSGRRQPGNHLHGGSWTVPTGSSANAWVANRGGFHFVQTGVANPPHGCTRVQARPVVCAQRVDVVFGGKRAAGRIHAVQDVGAVRRVPCLQARVAAQRCSHCRPVRHQNGYFATVSGPGGSPRGRQRPQSGAWRPYLSLFGQGCGGGTGVPVVPVVSVVPVVPHNKTAQFGVWAGSRRCDIARQTPTPRFF